LASINVTSLSGRPQRFFPPFLLAAANSAPSILTVEYCVLLTLLTSAFSNLKAPGDKNLGGFVGGARTDGVQDGLERSVVVGRAIGGPAGGKPVVVEGVEGRSAGTEDVLEAGEWAWRRVTQRAAHRLPTDNDRAQSRCGQFAEVEATAL